MLWVIAALVVSACVPQGSVGALPGDQGEFAPVPPTDQKARDAGGDVLTSPLASEDAPSPTLESMSPATALVGADALEVEVRGTGFVERTTLQVSGLPVPTQVVSQTLLRAILAPKWLYSPGNLLLSVGTAPPGGGASAELVLGVVYPSPFLNSISPTGVGVGASDTTVTLSGRNFTSSTGVRAGDLELVVQTRSATSLTAVVPRTLLGTSGVFPLVAWNPTPGGGATQPLSFVVSNPDVVISSLAPAVLRVGDGATMLTVVGAGFVPSSLVQADGMSLPTTFVSATQLRARFSTTSLAATFAMTVFTPPPGGGLSAPVQLAVVNPVPTLTGSSVSSVVVGCSDTAIVLSGTGFVPTSTVTVGGEAVSTTYIDSKRLGILVPARMMSTGGFFVLQVQNPAPGGGTSGTVEVTVTNPQPVIVSASTLNIPRGTSRTTVSLSTTGVVAGAVVYLNSAAMTTRVGLSGLVSADLVWPTHEVVQLRIRNPEPSGGASAPLEITVDCDARGAEILFPTVNVVQSASANLASQSRFASFDAATVGMCATVTGATVPVLGRGTTQPVRAVVVQNTTFSPVALEAWAACDTTDGAAFLSIYPGRRSMPTSYDDRRMCSGVVARGGAFSSPDSPTAPQCPGLTWANAGAVTVGVCETAVVVLQSINVAVPSTLPSEVRMRVRPASAAAAP